MKKPSLGSRLGYVLARSGLILAGLLLGLATVELVLRIVPVPNRFVLLEQLSGMWKSDPELLLHLRPNLSLAITGHPEFRFRVVTNADGLRDGPLNEAKIVAIGDSFTFGFGVEAEEAWPERIADLSGLEVANLGWAGWNSFAYPIAIRRHAVPLRADVWLWTFFVNDLQESAGAEAFVRSGNQDFKNWAMESGMGGGSLNFPLNTRTGQLVAALLNPDLFLLPDSGSGILDNGTIRIRYSQYAWKMTDPSDPIVQRGWELTEAAMNEARFLASSEGVELIVVFIPTREHVYWPYLEPVMEGVTSDQLDQVEARLNEMCSKSDIAYINLLPGFRERALAGEVLYFPNDGHWNAKGHALAAQLIYANLSARSLLPRGP